MSTHVEFPSTGFKITQMTGESNPREGITTFCCYWKLTLQLENFSLKRTAPSGRSAAWLARIVRDDEVESSNLSAPTIFHNFLRKFYALVLEATGKGNLPSANLDRLFFTSTNRIVRG